MSRTLLLAANLALECLLLIREASSSHSTCSCSASGVAGCLLQFCLILDVESIVTSQPFRLWRRLRQSLTQAVSTLSPGIDHKLTDAPSCLIPKSEHMHWLRCANRRPSPPPPQSIIGSTLQNLAGFCSLSLDVVQPVTSLAGCSFKLPTYSQDNCKHPQLQIPGMLIVFLAIKVPRIQCIHTYVCSLAFTKKAIPEKFGVRESELSDVPWLDWLPAPGQTLLVLGPEANNDLSSKREESSFQINMLETGLLNLVEFPHLQLPRNWPFCSSRPLPSSVCVGFVS